MYNRILVPTDVSEASRKALLTALELARRFNSELEVLHVTYTPRDYMGYAISYGISISEEDMEKMGEAALDAALTGINIDGVEVVKKRISGHPAEGILEEIKRDIDLVVMGSHGHGPIAGAFLGSVTQRVLAHAKCPVLVVK